MAMQSASVEHIICCNYLFAGEAEGSGSQAHGMRSSHQVSAGSVHAACAARWMGWSRVVDTGAFLDCRG